MYLTNKERGVLNGKIKRTRNQRIARKTQPHL